MFVILTIFLIEIIIFIHEMGHFLSSKFLNMPVSEFCIGFGPKIATICGKNITYSLKMFPIGGYVSFDESVSSGRGYYISEKKAQGSKDCLNESVSGCSRIFVFKKMSMLLFGPLFNIASAVVAIFIALALQGRCSSMVVKDVNIKNDKILVGDEIKYINGKYIFGINDFLYEFSKIDPDEMVDLSVIRDGKILDIKDVGYLVKGEKGYKKSLGICLGLKNLKFLDVFVYTYKNFMSMFKLILDSFVNIFKKGPFCNDLSGPVGLSYMVGKAREKGFIAIVFLFAFLSMNIGILNLLPISILDGGQFVFCIFEFFFKKSNLNYIKNIINGLGYIFFIFMFIFITIKDIFSNFLKF